MLGLSFLELGVYNFTKLGRNTGTEFGGGNFRKITRTSTNMQLHTYICTYMYTCCLYMLKPFDLVKPLTAQLPL